MEILKGYYHHIVLLHFWVVFDAKTRIATFKFKIGLVNTFFHAVKSTKFSKKTRNLGPGSRVSGDLDAGTIEI